MQSKPLVSVIIVAFNQKDYIRAAINAVLSQDYQNLEVIVCDDASTDGTQRVIEEVAADTSANVRPVLGQKNIGISGNCNRGFYVARGEFVCWQGGDDLMDREKISRQVEHLLATSDAAANYHDAELFESKSGETLGLWSDRFRPRVGRARTVARYGTFMCAPTLMFRADCLPSWYCNEEIRHASDWLLLMEVLALSGKRLTYLPEPLLQYRRHAKNISKTLDYSELIDSAELVIQRYPRLKRAASKRLRELRFINAYRQVRSQGGGMRKALAFAVIKGSWVPPFRIVLGKLRGVI